MKTSKKNKIFEDLLQGLEEIQEYQKNDKAKEFKTHTVNRISVKQIKE